mmetsp:Transcript_22318/g.26495  ORF Transcript_22318/g.26495 Transcript_22318/m.26495 type:complete len:240 (-) Transcript_22318:7-726(-)
MATSSFHLASILFLLLLVSCGAFSLKMSSASSTKFVTNKMCPFAQKAWIALEVSNTLYEFKEISLYGSNGKPDWFWKLNPLGTVPVLSCNDGASVIPDSELILDYIGSGPVEIGAGADHNKLALDPTNVDLVDSVKMWRRRISEKVIPLGKSAVLGGGEKDLFQLLKELNENVEGPYLCGDSLTLADCASFPFLWRIDQEFGPLTEESHGCGKFRIWLDLCQDSDAFSKTVQSSWWWWW